MRRVRLSQAFVRALKRHLREGADRFGFATARSIERKLDRVIFHHLPRSPLLGRRHNGLGRYVFHVPKTPFILLYDFNERELRMHLVVVARSNWADAAGDAENPD